ncbi:UNVERIFIED_CONTAM: Alkaline/neutral invertase CINV1 [Sesamum angustifolium]|uniref:Alkaline/neutral invertase CINV1 n=1 Tax=Sesamum angustifolium TaxID=2727405 RepID=A0AAW2NYV7_9LAMI
MPDSLPEWVFDFMPLNGGYFVGNVGPSNMDFRWFCLGNCVAILSSLATHEQSTAIMDLIESRWGSWSEKCRSKFVIRLSRIMSGASLQDVIPKIRDGVTTMLDHGQVLNFNVVGSVGLMHHKA